MVIKFDFRCRNVTGFTLKIPFQLQTGLGGRKGRKKGEVTSLFKNKPNCILHFKKHSGTQYVQFEVSRFKTN